MDNAGVDVGCTGSFGNGELSEILAVGRDGDGLLKSRDVDREVEAVRKTKGRFGVVATRSWVIGGVDGKVKGKLVEADRLDDALGASVGEDGCDLQDFDTLVQPGDLKRTHCWLNCPRG